MQVELIGCTSAGKTTLAREMVQTGRELGVDVQLSDDFLLERGRLSWIKNDFLRRRVIELWALLTCLVFWQKYRELYRFIIRTCLLAPGSRFYKVKLARVALRKIGIFELIRCWSSDRQVVLLDNEGVLQGSHTLFIHATGASDTSNLPNFLRLVPLPDVVAYLRQSEPVLIERTRKRGHNRIPENSNDEDIESFIKQAVIMFEELRQHPRLSDRLLVIDGERNNFVTGKLYNNSSLAKAAKLIQAGIKNTPGANGADTKKDDACQALPPVQT